MDFIYFTILFSIVMIILNFLFIAVGLFDFLIRIPFISSNAILVPDAIRKNIDSIISNILSNGNPILLFFIIFYIIFYLIYIIIKTIIPDTGIATFFIPLKELLLQIPPLPALEENGIFRLFECIIEAFGATTSFKSFVKLNLCFIDFSRDNIKTILKMILKDTEINFFENTSDNKNIEKKEEKKEEENIVYKNIEENVNMCYKNNRIPYKIGMTQTEIRNTDYSNNQEFIKCKANSIGKYIRII